MANDSERTTRIGYLCSTIVAMGFLIFLAKTSACSIVLESCNTPPRPPICHDEFIPFDGSDRRLCSPGAKGEVVNATPAVVNAKGDVMATSSPAGILCHCTNSPQPKAGPVADAGPVKVLD